MKDFLYLILLTIFKYTLVVISMMLIDKVNNLLQLNEALKAMLFLTVLADILILSIKYDAFKIKQSKQND